MGGRIKPLVPFLIVAVGAVGLTFKAQADDASDAAFQKERAKADVRAKAAVRLAMDGVPPEGPLAMLARSPEIRGPELFDKYCAGCHTFGEHGDEKERNAPKLDGWSTERWILDMLHDPDGDERFGRTAYKGEMPSMDVKPKDADESWTPMSAEDMKAAAAFLASQWDAPLQSPPPNSLRADPKRVTRGGSFLCNVDYCLSYRPSARRGNDPYNPMSHIGFRLVMDQKDWQQRKK